MIEDNPGDVMLLRANLDGIGAHYTMDVAEDGDMALDYLSFIRTKEQPGCPDMIVLDLNLPRKGGKEILTWIKSNENIKHVPVIIFTSSDLQQDINDAYSLYANSFIVKPFDVEEYQRIARRMWDYWTDTTALPGPLENSWAGIN